MLLEKGGLFPSPREIHFDCSCPDWAYMCKHVAAVMYGIGVRLYEDTLYFFALRGIDARERIYKSVDDKIGSMLKNAGRKSSRVLIDENVEELFGLQQESPVTALFKTLEYKKQEGSGPEGGRVIHPAFSFHKFSIERV